MMVSHYQMEIEEDEQRASEAKLDLGLVAH